MVDRVIREDRDIVTSGSLVCPAFDRCDRQPGEGYSAYVRRHSEDHNLGEFGLLEDAERNLGVWCFYYFHKYIFGNKTLLPQPFYELHAFIAHDEWNEDDLQERVPINQKVFGLGRIPDAADRRPGDVRSMKQIEVPRQCEKTSIGSNAYSLFISLHEYYVSNERVYPIMIRSETAQNARDSLAKIRAKAIRGRHIKRLYGVRLIRCAKCLERSHVSMKAVIACPACGATTRLKVQEIAIVDPSVGAGGTGKDSVTFRWATNIAEVGQAVVAVPKTLAEIELDYDPDSDDFDPAIEDEEAAYSVRAVGLKTALMGQRPRLYILDDIQSEDNSDTHEKRMKIEARFDEAKRQVEFGGRMFVFNTRKYVSDFAGKISVEPLRSLFHTLHRRVYWETDEEDAPPYVVAGMRYYYQIDGDGNRTLDDKEVADLERQMIEREFAAEYLNDPTDEKRATFKRRDFQILNVDDQVAYQRIPIEVRYGRGRPLTPDEEDELARQNLTIQAWNFWDPSGKEEQSKRGDDTFGVAIRLDRYGAIYIAGLAAGQWSATKTWDEVDRLNSWNRPTWNDYEMGVDEKNCKASFQKWLRDQFDKSGMTPSIPMHWSHMPKSTKMGRMEKVESWTSNGDFYILSDAGLGDAGIIEKYIGQWLALGRNADHDDGPDATSRGVKYFMNRTYQRPTDHEAAGGDMSLTSGVPWAMVKGFGHTPQPKRWGEVG